MRFGAIPPLHPSPPIDMFRAWEEGRFGREEGQGKFRFGVGIAEGKLAMIWDVGLLRVDGVW